MFLSLFVAASLGTTFDELKLDQRQFEWPISSIVTEGLSAVPFSKYHLRNVDSSSWTGEVKAELTRTALERVKTWVMSEAGRRAWADRLTKYQEAPFAERAASIAADVAYQTTIARERHPPQPYDAAALAKALGNEKAFKRDRTRYLKEDETRRQAAAHPDEQAFRGQLKERLTYFLAETAKLPWTAKLVERDKRTFFADPELELRPKWWKFCFRAGPEATGAAREVATAWLKELDAPLPPLAPVGSVKPADDK
jgi:hypothetical protein